MFVWNRSPGKEKRSKRENKNIFVFSFFYIKQLKICWKGQIMEDIKINNEKLNKAIEKNDLPKVPRKIDGSIDLEAITIKIDEKGNRIIEDEILNNYYRELPKGIINKSGTWRTNGTGGKLKILGGNPEADKEIHKKGGEALQATLKQQRSIQETVKIMLAQKATPEEIEAYNLPEGATKQDAMTAAMLARVIEQKDVAAFNSLRDTAGEKPTEKISAEVETITPEDRKQIERILNRTKAQDIVVNGNQEQKTS